MRFGFNYGIGIGGDRGGDRELRLRRRESGW